MGGCGGSKKTTSQKTTNPSTPKFGSPPKNMAKRTNWNTGGFGTPKVKFSFAKGK
jgi:hypothetical protein